MERLIIPNTELRVSRLAAGCMGLGGGWGKGVALTKEHEKQASEFLDSALSLGIDFFDHANIYAVGRAEEVFGRAMRARPGLREKIVIQSKCGIRWADDPPGAPQRYDFSYESIVTGVDAILKRLGTDYLDILLLHRPDALWEGEEIARSLRRNQGRGKGPLFPRFQPEPRDDGVPAELPARPSRGQPAPDEPPPPWFRGDGHLLQPRHRPATPTDGRA